MAFDRNWGLKELIGGVGQGLERRQNLIDALRQRDEQQQYQKELGDYLETRGLPRSLINHPEYAKIALKESLRPKSFMQELLDELFPSRKQRNQFPSAMQNQSFSPQIVRDDKGNIKAVNIEGNLIPADQIPPQTLQQLEMAEAQMQSQGGSQPTTWGQSLGQFGTGVGAGLLSKALGFLPDIASLPLAAQNLGANPTDVKNWEYEMLERNPNQQGVENLNPQEAIAAYNQMRPLESLEKALPTTQNILNTYIPAVTKGTALEPYTVPKKGEETAQELGSTTGILSNLTGSIGQKAANILKSAGVALTGQAAKALGTTITGSEGFGEALKLGTYIGASLYPGHPGKLGAQEYEKFGKEVVDKAVAEGKNIQASPLRDKIKEFSAKVQADFPHLTEDAKLLQNEIAKAENSIFSSTPKTGYLKDEVSPDRLWNSIKDIGKKVRDQKYHTVTPYLDELMNIEKEALESFANTVTPNGGQILKDANNLYRTGKQLEKDQKFLKSTANIKFGPGTLLWLTSGGYKAVAALAGAKAATNFVNRMVNNPTIVNLTKKLAEASLAQNVTLAKHTADRLNKKAESIVDQLPEADKKNIRDALKKLKNEPVK